MCVCVFVCSGGKGREERDVVMVESKKKKKKEKLSFRRIGGMCGGVFEIRYLLRGDERINNKWKRFGGESGLENLISRLGRRVVIS